MEYLFEVVRGGDGKKPKSKVRYALAQMTLAQLDRIRQDAAARFAKGLSGKVLRDQLPTLIDEVQWLDKCFEPLTPGFRVRVHEPGMPARSASLVGFDHRELGIYFWTVFGTERVRTYAVPVDELASPSLLSNPHGRVLIRARGTRAKLINTPAKAGERIAP